MKRIAISVALLIVPTIAFADPVKRNESQSTMYAADGDTGPHRAVDRYGNILVISQLASPANYWSACSATASGTGNVTIKGGTVSVRTYVTSITCGNQSTVSTQLNFKDGTTTISNGWVGPNTGNAGFTATYPVPLRLTAAADFNFSPSTTSSSTICCAAGFTSAN